MTPPITPEGPYSAQKHFDHWMVVGPYHTGGIFNDEWTAQQVADTLNKEHKGVASERAKWKELRHWVWENQADQKFVNKLLLKFIEIEKEPY